MVSFADTQKSILLNESKVKLRRSVGFTGRLLVAGLLVLFTVHTRPAVAVEGGSPFAVFKKVSPAALRGDREALREAAKAIVKMGPREFRFAPQMRAMLHDEALRGSSAAANAYAMMLQYGIGGPPRPQEAPAWYARGSERGNISASKSGAVAYALGWGVRRDTNHAMNLLKGVPPDQRARRMLEISKALLQPGREEPEPALIWLRRAIALDSGGNLNAADVYEQIAAFSPVAEDQMISWLQPLADKGNSRAAMKLATRLAARGKAGDLAEASRLYLVAAEKNEPHAYEALGAMLASVPNESASAILAHMEGAADSGSGVARMVLGNYYLFQSADSEDLRDRGLNYLRLAAKDGNPEAQYRLAMMLLGGSADQAQHLLAQAYLVLAAEGGNPLAEIAVAQLGNMPLPQAREIVDATIQ